MQVDISLNALNYCGLSISLNQRANISWKKTLNNVIKIKEVILY